jgi:hypothetical protein
VLVEEPRGTPNMELEQTDEVTGSLDSTQSIVGGGFMERTHRFFAKGSGAAGTAPEFAPYLQAAAMGVTTLAADSDRAPRRPALPARSRWPPALPRPT